MKRSAIVAAMLVVVSGTSSMNRLVPPWATSGGPLGGRVRVITGDSSPGGSTGTTLVGGETMTAHFGVPNGWRPIDEASGLPSNNWDLDQPDGTASFVIAVNGENGGETGGVFRTQNFLSPAGSPGTWVEVTTGLPVKKNKKTYAAVAVENSATPQIAHVGHSSGQGIYSTADGGNSWTQTLATGFVNALAIDPSNGMIALAATAGGTFRTSTGGAPWTLVDGPTPTVDVVIDPSTTTRVYAVRSTAVRFSTDGGTSWASSSPPGTGYDLRAITRPHVSSPNWLYVCGAATTAGPAGTQEGDGVIYQTTWTGALPPTGPPWSPNLATYGTPAFQAPGPFPRHNPFNAVAFDGVYSSWLYVGLDGGGLFWSPGDCNGGSTTFDAHTPYTPGPPATGPTFGEGNSLCSIAFPPEQPLIGTEIRELAAQPVGVGTGKLFAGGDSRTVWFRDPNPPPPGQPTNWLSRNVPLLPAGSGGWGWHAVTSVAFDIRVTPNRVYVGDGTRIQVSQDDGASWTLIFPPIGSPPLGGEITEIAVAPDRPMGQPFSTLLVGTTVGVYRSTDGGATFSAPTGPANVINLTFDRDYGPGTNLSVFAAVEGPSGGFFRSLDPSDGAAWSGAMNSGLPANPGLTIIGHKGAGTLFAGSGSGNLNGVFISNDLGQSWRLTSALSGPETRVFGLAVSNVTPTGDVVYASTRGGILRSQDDGTNWTDFSFGLINTRCGPLRLSPFGGPSLHLFAGTEGRGVYFAFPS